MASVVAFTLVMGAAWGYWFAGSDPGGNGAAAATTVNAGAIPTLSANEQSVTVSWAASTLSNGGPVAGYIVKRFSGSTPQTVHAACAGTVAATSCIETNVPAGTWTYSVTPVLGANWTGTESAKSSTVTVAAADATNPVNAVTLSGVTGGAFKSGNTIYYRGVAAGSFTVANAVTDGGSGPASSATATLTGTSTGWTHTPSTVSSPAGGPYVSNAFSWTAGATTSPGEVVTGRDVANNSGTTTLSMVNDSTAPTAGSISYLDGYQPGRLVTATFAGGTDTGGSGIASRRLQRASAPLSAGACGTFTGFSDRGTDSPTSPYNDNQVANGNCYKYRFVVTDQVGNQDLATSASVAKIDYANAVGATTGLLSHWRLGEASATLGSADSFTGSSTTALTSHTGEVGATWTHQLGTTTEILSSENRARRSGAGYTIDYTTATPASANYSVEADLYYKGGTLNTGKGVIGRLNTANSTYYMARWETDKTWNIVKGTGSTPAWLATSALNSATLVAGETYRVKLDMNGTTIKLFVNGVQVLSAVDSSLAAAGKAGIMDGQAGSAAGSDTTGLHIDNFQVTPAAYPRAADNKGRNIGDYKNGVTQGVAGAMSGDTNTAGQFDGVNDYVNMTGTTGIPVGAATRSVEMWFKTSSASRQTLFAYGAGATNQEFGLWIDAGGTSMTSWGYGGGNDKQFPLPYAVNDGNWHNVVETYNGTTLVIYIDGVALTSQAATRATVMDPTGFVIGAVIRSSDGNFGGFFNGSIDEVSFYTSVLSQATVTNHYQLGTGLTVTATAADLAYIENGTTALDTGVAVASADDANLTSATVDMTTNYVNGEDTLAFTTMGAITGTWTASTGVLALSGSATVAEYQAALRSITYNNNSNFPTQASRTVTTVVSDGTNVSNIASRKIAITAVNDPPVGTGGTLTVNEDASYTFATADFGMYDTPDNGANALLAVKMTTLPAVGALKLSGVAVTAGQFVSAANITSGLLTFTPVAGANGTGYASFSFQVQDDGGTANGGSDLDASPNTFTFNVTAVNDAPVNSVPAGQTTPKSTPEVFSTGNGSLISVSDIDAGSAQVQLVSTNGATTLSTTSGLAFTVGDGTADTTMTFTGTIAAVNTALDGLSFNPTTNFTGAASLQIVTNDQGNTGTGGVLTDTDTVAITVTTPPVVTTTGANLNFTENGANVALDAGITVTDADASTLTGATVSMTTNYVNGQDTLIYSTLTGITGSWNASTGILTLTGNATVANYQAALRSIQYRNTSNAVVSGNHAVTFVVSDGVPSNTATRQIALSAVNDAPVNTKPAAQTTGKNIAEVFSTANANLISISDADAASSPVQVQLVGVNGATTLSTTGGLTFTVGDGIVDTTMTFTGTTAYVNTALVGMSFTPTTNFTGAASLQIITNDQGNTGSGGALSDNDTVAITVTPPYNETIVAETSLVNYYRLGEASGTSIVDSEGTNTGTYFGGPTLAQAGAIAGNTAAQFDGVNDYGSVARQVSGNFSLEFWFKSTQGIGTDPRWSQGAGLVDSNITGTNNDFGVSLRSDGVIVAGIGGGIFGDTDVSISSGAGYNDGQWHHVVFTRVALSSVATLYVDGSTLVSASTGNIFALTGQSVITFGRLASGTNFYQGSLDEIAIYNAALTPAQVTAHYNAR
ncbi:MAG: LamG domain-containing protein [Actinomycetota bacterium]|nr:LamG domain-containing protein [Actinomycetota bacterium]